MYLMVSFLNMRKVKIALLFPIYHETNNMLPKLFVVSKDFTAMFTISWILIFLITPTEKLFVWVTRLFVTSIVLAI